MNLQLRESTTLIKIEIQKANVEQIGIKQKSYTGYKIEKLLPKLTIQEKRKEILDESMSSQLLNGSICRFKQEKEEPKKKQEELQLVSKRDQNTTARKIETFKQENEMELIHQIGFRFEKSAKLRRKSKYQHSKQVQNQNQLIVKHIEENINIILNVPMILFYCLYYCVFYKNYEMLGQIRDVVSEFKLSNRRWKIKHKYNFIIKKEQIPKDIKTKFPLEIDKIDELIIKFERQEFKQLIDRSNPQSQEFLHIVFYQAIDDNIRFIYEQVFYEVIEINLRDKDAMHFIKQENFQIIQDSFQKVAKGLFTGLFMHSKYRDQVYKKYQYYDRSYFLEIMIKNDTEQRVINNFKIRFLNNNDDTDNILNLFCKLDDLQNFSNQSKEVHISKQRIQDLFLMSLRNESFKVVFHLHYNYDIVFNNQVKQAIINQIKEQPNRHFEYKLYFMRHLFQTFNFQDYDQLLTVFEQVFKKDPQNHPIINCYNPIKCSVQVYKIIHNINQKKIYSLERKCNEVIEYIQSSLEKYLNEQQNISHLYKLMREPVLDPNERKDAMDLMLQFDMNRIIQHKVVEEVLNLVFDGKYSIDSTMLDISTLWVFINQMETFSTNCIWDKLYLHVVNLAEWKMKKQFSFQYHIWKQCIRQREQDEMLFLGAACVIIIGILVYITTLIGNQYQNQVNFVGDTITNQIGLLDNLSIDILQEYCESEVQQSIQIYQYLKFFQIFQLLLSISYLSETMCLIAPRIVNINFQLDFYTIIYLATKIVSGFYFTFVIFQQYPSILSQQCLRGIPGLDIASINALDYVYGIQASINLPITFQIALSIVVIQVGLNIIALLKRTERIGVSIVMIETLRIDLQKFVMAFSIPFLTFVVIGSYNLTDLTLGLDAWNIFLQLFSTFTGQNNFYLFKNFQGQLFLIIFIFVYFVVLQNFIVAMFSNTYSIIQKNKKSIPLRRILEIKNRLSYDPIIGSVTSSFFPFNILILPFIPIIVFFQNKNFNESLNRFQYILMVTLYSVLLLVFQIILFPILLIKIIFNTIHIMVNLQDQSWYDNYIRPILILVGAPVIILMSILVDFLTLPTICFRNEQQFEEKYQKNNDEPNDNQQYAIGQMFQKILYQKWDCFKGKFVTYLELCCMHRSYFGIMENLNDLICKGIKDYRETLLKVQDYNFTKILAKICSVPSNNGNIVENIIYFDMMKSVYEDVLFYNHLLDLINGGKGIYGLFSNGNKMNSHKIQLIVNYRMFKKNHNQDEEQINGDDYQIQLNTYDQFMRDPYDIMNFYQTNILCETYSDINNFKLTKKEKSLENKISQLFSKVDELIYDEELEIVEKINDKLLHKKTNYMQQKLDQKRSPITTSHFMNEILNDKISELNQGTRKKLRDQENMEITFETHKIFN